MNRIPRLALVALSAGTLMVATGCGPNTTVNRVQGNTVLDVSGNWNDTDARQVAQTLISDALGRPWLDNFIKKNNRNPKIRVSEVIVRATGESVNTAMFIKKMEEEFINSGKIDVVQSRVEAKNTRSEVDDAQKHSGENTPEAGKETAADFILSGEVSTQHDTEGQRSVKSYIVALTLINQQSGGKVWQKANDDIKKDVQKKNAKW